eukprot:6593180-Prymnesium_polylepis.1
MQGSGMGVCETRRSAVRRTHILRPRSPRAGPKGAAVTADATTAAAAAPRDDILLCAVPRRLQRHPRWRRPRCAPRPSQRERFNGMFRSPTARAPDKTSLRSECHERRR